MLDDGMESGTEDHSGFVKTQADDAHKGGEHANDLDSDKGTDRNLPLHVKWRLTVFDSTHGKT